MLRGELNHYLLQQLQHQQQFRRPYKVTSMNLLT
jgi:hypothetical protein